ncbi:MAG: ribosomal protein S18-alanine N-acetyltransferase [Candidatus Binatia bacterium]|nr:ribosomal protein S18-alanine N-acetyltransferase [Candidatus Binatia bacterium]
MVDVTVVPCDESLCKEVAALEVMCFGADAWPPEVFHTLCRMYSESAGFRGQIWVALDEQRRTVAGYVALEVTSLGEAELTNLAVAPACRRRGIGRRLVSCVIAACQQAGVELLWLRVRRSNQRAVRFYEACGFVKRGEFRDYYDDPREDALILALEVPEERGEDDPC